MMQIIDAILDLFDNSRTMSSSQVPFNPEVRTLCEQNMCGNYGKSWTCPPAIASSDDLQVRLRHFDHVIVFNKIYEIEDSFDWEGMQNGAGDFQSRVLKLKKSIHKIDPDFKCVVLGAGACRICETCTYKEEIPCRNPDNAIVSVEACGIDVVAMLKESGLKYNNGPNTVTYLGAFFYR